MFRYLIGRSGLQGSSGNSLLIRSFCSFPNSPWKISKQVRKDLKALQSENGEVKLSKYKFTDGLKEMTLQPEAKEYGCGIVVQTRGIRPNLKLIKRPYDNQWEVVSRDIRYGFLNHGAACWQFPPNPAPYSGGFYSISEVQGMDAIASHFLESDFIVDIQKKLQDLWKVHYNIGNPVSMDDSIEYLKDAVKQLSMSTISYMDIQSHLLDEATHQEAPAINNNILKYLVHQIIISTPFFMPIQGTTEYFVQTPSKVAEHAVLERQLRILLKAKEDKKYTADNLINDVIENSKKPYSIPQLDSDYSESFGIFTLPPRHEPTKLFLDVFRSFFLSRVGKMSKNKLDLESFKTLSSKLILEEHNEDLNGFWNVMNETSKSDYSSSFTGEQLDILEKHLFPLLEHTLKNFVINNEIHPVHFQSLSNCLRGIYIPLDTRVLRCLLIGLDQLPYMYCYESERFSRFWNDSLELTSLREDPWVKDIHKSLKKTMEDSESLVTFPEAYAIDNSDTTSIDDAISISDVKPGELDPWIQIHVADTSTYINPNSFIDLQARALTATQYFSNGFIRMLPSYIDKELSLEKGENRVLTFAAQLRKGRIIDYKIHFSYVKNIICTDYQEVQNTLRSSKDKTDPLKRMFKIAEQRRKARKPVPISEEPRLDSEILVEEFMVIAGDIAAKYCTKHQIPCFYRIQDPIPPEVFKQINQEHYILRQSLILERISSASYSLEPSSHFMAGLDSYCHVTSPLRRYVDMILHYQISAHLKKENLPFQSADLQQMLDRINTRTTSIRITDRRQKKQIMNYYYAEFGEKLVKGFVTKVSVSTKGETLLTLEPLVEELNGFHFQVNVGMLWPGNFHPGDIYPIEITCYPHINTVSCTLQGTTPVSTIESEFS